MDPGVLSKNFRKLVQQASRFRPARFDEDVEPIDQPLTASLILEQLSVVGKTEANEFDYLLRAK
jgi:hypothetical protein